MEDNTIKLEDGRNLGFSEYGERGGIPLMLLHGTPGCRIFKWLEVSPWATQFGFHVIVPERPGYGLSDPAPDRTIKSWATDVEELAEHLGLDRFYMAGISGGGAYALACAIHMPERIRSVALMCSSGPPEFVRLEKSVSLAKRVTFFLAKYAPFALKGLFAIHAKSIKISAGVKEVEKLPGWNRLILDESIYEYMSIPMREIFRQGGDGAYRDVLLISRPWGLNLDEVTVPVFMWHGVADTVVPISTARTLSKLIPGCETYFIPNAGHQLFLSERVWSQMASRMLSINVKKFIATNRQSATRTGFG